MFDYRTVQLMHLHGDERIPMHERPRDAADDDPGRGWVKGERIFRCSSCDEEVVVLPGSSMKTDAEAG